MGNCLSREEIRKLEITELKQSRRTEVMQSKYIFTLDRHQINN